MKKFLNKSGSVHFRRLIILTRYAEQTGAEHHDNKGNDLPAVRNNRAKHGCGCSRKTRELFGSDSKQPQNPVDESAVDIKHVFPDQTDDNGRDQERHGADGTENTL